MKKIAILMSLLVLVGCESPSKKKGGMFADLVKAQKQSTRLVDLDPTPEKRLSGQLPPGFTDITEMIEQNERTGNYEELYRWLKELNKAGVLLDTETGLATYYPSYQSIESPPIEPPPAFDIRQYQQQQELLELQRKSIKKQQELIDELRWKQQELINEIR